MIFYFVCVIYYSFFFNNKEFQLFWNCCLLNYSATCSFNQRYKRPPTHHYTQGSLYIYHFISHSLTAATIGRGEIAV